MKPFFYKGVAEVIILIISIPQESLEFTVLMLSPLNLIDQGTEACDLLDLVS